MSTPTPGAGISQEDIDSVAAAQEDMMPELVDVYKKIEARDSRGGVTVTWPTKNFTTIGRVGQVRDSIRAQFAGQLRGKALAMLTVPRATDIDEQDRVVVLGATYSIAEDLARSSFATAARYLIVEV